MAAVTPADVKARYPEFTSTPDQTVQDRINESAPFFDVDRWGKLLSQGVINWVAHYLTIDVDIASNAMTDDSIMKKVGDIAKSRSAKLVEDAADNDYIRTKYGGRYLRLHYLVSRGGMAV
jgi:hypothetical protein